MAYSRLWAICVTADRPQPPFLDLKVGMNMFSGKKAQPSLGKSTSNCDRNLLLYKCTRRASRNAICCYRN